MMSGWSKDEVVVQARDRGVFYVSQTAATADLRVLCAELVREGLLAAAGRRGGMLAYYPTRTLAPRNVASPRTS